MHKKIENRVKRISQSTLLIAASGCASWATPAIDVELKRDATVTIEGTAPLDIKTGSNIRLTDKPALVESPGHVSVFIIPPQNEVGGKLELDMRPIEEFGGAEFHGTINRQFAALLKDVWKVQRLDYEGKTDEALRILERLHEKYPYVSYLKILESSLLVKTGNTAKARLNLQQALRDFPDDEFARSLYESISTER